MKEKLKVSFDNPEHGWVSRERFPTFGEELALINYCNKPGPRGNAHLRAVLIIAVDTGLRENEMFTLEKSDIDFGSGAINVRRINAKTNRPVQFQ
jgi:integrase